MQTKFLLLLSALLLAPVFLFAQKYSLRGALSDTAKAPVVSATAMLLSTKDSALLAFTRSDANGVFEFKNLEKGAYLLRCTFFGLQNLQQTVALEGPDPVLDLGQLIMQEKNSLLDEVQVLGERDPVRFRGDTVEYNAGSFRVKDNAMVEDLLKKLPGVEVDKDGTVKAQGEEVKNITVEGKKFFGNDPKIATQNLPADAVDKVQVFDKKSDQATFSGVDDGQREKTINLQLKEDKKKGWFGNLSGGGGADLPDPFALAAARYEGRASLNSFKPKQQISLLGMANNVNQAGFSIDDYMAFSGAMRSMMGGGGGRVSLQFDLDNMDVPIDFGQNEGFLDTWAGGLNFNQEYGKRKSDFNASYFYSRSDRDYARSTNRQTFLPDGSFTTADESTQESSTDNHRVNVTIDQKIDSFNSVQLTSGFVYTQKSTESAALSKTLNENGLTQNDGDRRYASDAEGTNWTGNLLLRHKFRQKKGRNVSLNLNFGMNANDLAGNSRSRNRFFDDGGGVLRDTTIAQQQDFVNDVQNWGAKATFTEPLGKKRYLEFNYGYYNTDNQADKDVYDLNGDERTYNALLSNAYENTFAYHRGGAGFRINRKVWNLSLGLDAQAARLEGVVTEGLGAPVQRDFQHLLPRFNFHRQFEQNQNLDINYLASVNAPTVQQLQPVPDVSDPLNITEGNPDLKPEYAHNLNLHFHFFNPDNFRSFFSGLFATYTQDRIVMAQTIDSQLVRRYTPVNVASNVQLNGNFAYGLPVKKWDSRFNLSLEGRLNYGPNFINGVENLSTVTGFGPAFSWQFDPSEKISFSSEARLNWNNTHYSIDERFDQQYLIQEYSGDLNLELPKGFGFNTTFNLTVNNGLSTGFDQAVPIWNATVSKTLLKNKALELSVVVRDLLNRNVGIQRTANLNYIEDQRTASLGRHALLRLTYSLNTMGSGPGPRMRMMIRR
ncbi:MAG: outer membrane beta-barrel family protein [Saprospiraceae bacterium]|nr:outer membrane beta-barrel family protein [Saprospiraceae bacterium]